MTDLSEYRALVCGGTKGIGKAAADALVKRGAEVTILARTAEGENGISCDMENLKSLEENVKKDIEKNGNYQILIMSILVEFFVIYYFVIQFIVLLIF